MEQNKRPKNPERRAGERHPVKIDVNYRHADTYLFTQSHTGNLSELGVFLLADETLPTGTSISLQFTSAGDGETFTVEGEVAWIKSGEHGHPRGMGVQFVNPSEKVKERIQTLIRTMAYL